MPLKWKNNSLDGMVKKFTWTDSQINDFTKEALQELAKRLHELIQEKAPKKSGEYADSWKVDDVNNNKITVSSPDGNKFTILEFTGKRQTHVEAAPGKVLHFVINGEDIFVKWSNPGAFGPIPHVRPALEQLGREGKEIIVKIMKKRFPVFS